MRKATDKKYDKLILSVPYLKDLETEKIGIDNGVAYFTNKEDSLTHNEVKGINCILMSKQFDDYYRMFNSTNTLNIYEFENMNFPNLETINLIGENVKDDYISVEVATKIFGKFLL